MKNSSIAKRRILTLVAAACLCVALAGGFYAFRRHRNRVQLASWRDEGMRAYKAGDDAVAVDKLTLYLTRHAEDPEALAVYVEVRPRVELPRFAHLAETLRAVRYLLQLEPDRIEYRRRAMGLFEQLGLRTETVECADIILKASPNDAEALRAKTDALIDLKRYDDALLASNKWVDVEPLNLSALVKRLTIHALLGHTAAAISNEIDQWGAAHPDQQAQLELLKGIACSVAGDRAGTLEFLRKAAKRVPPDDTFSQMLVAQLGGMGDPNEDVAVLKDLIARGGGAALRQTLLCRLWEMGDAKAADELARGMDLRAASVPVQVVALASLAAKQMGNDADATARRELIASRPGPVARAWADLLGTSAADIAATRSLAARCRAALEVAPNETYLRFFLGQALAGLQESDLAIEAWQGVAQANLTWSEPLVRMSELLLQQGRLDRAAEAATAAFHRAASVSSAVAVARVAAAMDDAGRGLDRDALLKLLDEVQKIIPGNPEVALLRFRTLARAGQRGAAAELIRPVLSGSPPPDEEFLLRLAWASQALSVGIEDEIFKADERLHGVTPALAFKRAQDALAAGHAADAMRIFRSSRPASTTQPSVEWALAEARLLDLSADPGAKAAWRSLAEQYPTDLTVQQSLLRAHAPRDDRALLEATLGRVRAILGEQSLVCSFDRVQVLMQTRAGDADDREIAEILRQIIAAHPNLTEPRVLWAQSLQRAGKIDDAIDQLRLAVQANPDAVGPSLRLAQLYREKGNYSAARPLLDHIAASKAATPAELKAVVSMLQQQGDLARAQSVLEQIDAAAGHRPDLALAEFYWRGNQPEKVESILVSLMANPQPELLAFAARFYTARGKADQARQAIETLQRLPSEPGRIQLAKGDCLAAEGKVDEAIARYRAAAAAAPKDPRAWRALIAYLFLNHRSKEAVDATIAAAAVAPADEWLTAVNASAPALVAATEYPSLHALVSEYLHDPQNSPAAGDVIRSVAKASAAADGEEAESQARSLSQKYTDVEGAQLWAVQVYLKARRFADAGAVLSRATTTFPESAAVASAATAFHGARRQWAEMLDAARQWRRTAATDADRQRADAATATALQMLGRPAEAVTLLQPYFPGGHASSDQRVELVMANADCLMAAGEAHRAAELLAPLATAAQPWRSVCIRFAAQRMDEADARAWLTRAAGSVDEKAGDDLQALAQGWEVLAERFPAKADLLTEAARQFEKLERREGVSAAALEAAAIFAERRGDAPKAIGLYRRALALDSRRPLSLNELAVLLAADGGNLDEAAKYATAVVACDPAEPEFLDTLATVKSKAGDHPAAAKSYARCVELDPENPRWRIGLAQSLLDAGQKTDAAKVVAVLDTTGTDLTRLPPILGTQLAAIRAHLQPSTEKGARN